MVTKAELAKLAGVSPATISNFYNGKSKLSQETKERIMQAARELNYPLPHLIHQNSKSKTVLVVVEDILNPHYTNILEGMHKVAADYSVLVSMCCLWADLDKFCEMIINSNISAVYFAIPPEQLLSKHIELLNANGVKVIFSEHNFLIDFDLLLDKAIKYLADLGHTRIAYLAGKSLDDKTNSRYHRFVKALENNNIPFDSSLMIDGIFPYMTDAKNGYWATKLFLEKKLPFTAIVTMNDLLAFGCMHALYEQGYKIPDDVSVIGCDNIALSEYSNPPLTTMNLATSDMGAQTMYSILNPSNDIHSSKVTLQIDLIIRQSTGKAM